MSLSKLCADVEHLPRGTSAEAFAAPLTALDQEYRKVLSALVNEARETS
jgi:hypothetical protein